MEVVRVCSAVMARGLSGREGGRGVRKKFCMSIMMRAAEEGEKVMGVVVEVGRVMVGEGGELGERFQPEGVRRMWLGGVPKISTSSSLGADIFEGMS